jgi:phage host-nuclease inhibitor protein Gam
MTTVDPTASAITKEYMRRIAIWVSKALPVLLEELKRLTPEDTKEMLDSFKTDQLLITTDTVTWTITNTSWHAIFVEYWVNWLTYNYHKPKWSVFYKWVGNRTFARAIDNTRDKVIEIIYNEINK